MTYIRIIGGISLLCLALVGIIFSVIGNHGKLLLRPNMTEDWVILDTVFILILLGPYLLYKGLKKADRKHR